MIQVSDMDTASPSLKAQILGRISQGATNAVWTPTDFLDFGSRDAVDKTLQRLVKSDELRRVDRGLYDKPQFNRLTGQNGVPDPRAVIDAVARRDQIRILGEIGRAHVGTPATHGHLVSRHHLKKK